MSTITVCKSTCLAAAGAIPCRHGGICDCGSESVEASVARATVAGVLPSPERDEGRGEFMDRCQIDTDMRNRYFDSDERRTMCNALWNRHADAQGAGAAGDGGIGGDGGSLKVPGRAVPPATNLLPTACRGRGAVAVQRITMRLRTRNVAGRSKLLFAYRPLKTWNEATLRLVHGLLERYFERIGGFRVARDCTVRTWHEALASGMYTADELRWAIDAKAASLVGDTPAETRAKRRFVCGPGRFLDFAGYWLEQSPEYRARVAQRQESEWGGHAARLAGARDTAVRRGLDDIKARVKGRLDIREEQRDRVAARRAAVWGSLSPARQAVALQATRRAFRERCEQWGMAPDSPELVELRTDYAMNWAASKWPPPTETAGVLIADRT